MATSTFGRSTGGVSSLGLRKADDATLVRAVQAGDMAAYTELYNRYEPAVRRLCGRWLSDPLVVDDVVQAAFVRAFEHIDKCSGDSRFSGWVQVIAHRLCIDAGRAAARRRGAAERAERAATVPASVPEDPIDAVLRYEQVDALQVAIAELPPRQREVVVARLVEGRRPSEIAATLGMTIAAVDSLLLRARKRLAAAYGTIVDEGGHMTLAAVTTVSLVAGPVSAAATRGTGVGRAIRAAAVALATAVAATVVPTATMSRPSSPARPASAAPAAAAAPVALTDDPVDSWSISSIVPPLANESLVPVIPGPPEAMPPAVRQALDRMIGSAGPAGPAGPSARPAVPAPAAPLPNITLGVGVPADGPAVPPLAVPPLPLDPNEAPAPATRPLPSPGGVREWRS